MHLPLSQAGASDPVSRNARSCFGLGGPAFLSLGHKDITTNDLSCLTPRDYLFGRHTQNIHKRSALHIVVLRQCVEGSQRLSLPYSVLLEQGTSSYSTYSNSTSLAASKS
jgi:hypothetical protein